MTGAGVVAGRNDPDPLSHALDGHRRRVGGRCYLVAAMRMVPMVARRKVSRMLRSKHWSLPSVGVVCTCLLELLPGEDEDQNATLCALENLNPKDNTQRQNIETTETSRSNKTRPLYNFATLS